MAHVEHGSVRAEDVVAYPLGTSQGVLPRRGPLRHSPRKGTVRRGDRVGTHNLDVHTGKAEAEPFAEWLLFTEAKPGEVRRDLPADYVVDECRRNRSLVVAWHEGSFIKDSDIYVPAHPGLRKVTPARGTYAVLGRDAVRVKTALVVEWRINAARPPYRRGEATLRRMLHSIHSANTERLVRRLMVVC